MALTQDKEKLFKEMYAEYSPKVHRLCLGYTGSMVEADDLLQEIFIKAWQHFDRFRGDAKISTWLYRIAVNTCLCHLRTEKGKKTVDLENFAMNRAEENDDKEQQVDLLYMCINELADAEKLIITMVLEEVPYNEIAAVTEISEVNLRVRIHRIKSKLSSIYARHDRV